MNPLRVGILGAGLGSRLQARSKAKPLAPVAGKSLLEHLLFRLRAEGIFDITCALREELFGHEERAQLPQIPGVSYIFVNTESSLHTLGALIDAMGTEKGTALFTMADTVLHALDLQNFLAFASTLAPSENAVLTTTFVDDEKPLWVHTSPDGLAVRFSSDRGQCITSGIYVLQPAAMEIAQENIRAGRHKMRNFLADLAQRQIPVKTFVVKKTIDVDHPADLDKAEEFLSDSTAISQG
jgi:NDP-sugar pyrophosphorylase family protein